MVAPLPSPATVEVHLLPQEQPGNCRFSGQFVATRNAIARFGEMTIVAALRILHQKVAQGEALDYLQVFEIGGQRLWIIDDGDVTTALLPMDY